MDKFIKIIIIISFSMVSCDKWLDVSPDNSITEEILLSSKEGFEQSLNGVYLDLNNSSLYGATLLCKEIDILAQYYNISPDNADYKDLASYKYGTKYPKQVFERTWNDAYKLIITINKLLSNLDKQDYLSKKEYNLFKGELSALRAMLHFDLLRIFGPSPKDFDKKAIVYNKLSFARTQEPATFREVCEMIISDLNVAEKLLEDDPIITKGALAFNFGNDNSFFTYRTLRLNYYAVKGLQARVYLYCELIDASYKRKAFEAATKVIEENDAKEWFTFVSPTEIQGSTPNRIFSSEILFMNQNNRRVDIFKNLFAPSVNNLYILAPSTNSLEAMYIETDYRYRPSWLLTNEKSFRCFYKYASVANGSSNDLVPMIRLSEMYLIAAETSENKLIGLNKYLNYLIRKRYGREVDGVDNLEKAIEKEYRREFIGEGQMFFYYKRKNTTIIEHSNTAMKPQNYIVPLPDSEIRYR